MTISAAARPILIAGPTASGKSALATELARRMYGVVVNADSQQVYREWRVLTARPSPDDEAAVPHRLYGHVGLAEPYSVGRWLEETRHVLDACRRAGRRPIVAGGTGLFFKALTEGLAPIPDVPPEVRAAGEAELRRSGLVGFADDLARRDPRTAARLDLSNPRRVLRAWEVLEATGTGLAEWQARTPLPLLPVPGCVAVVLDPPRPWLYARCETRLDAMLAAGALDEVARVMALGLPRHVSGWKAVGATELGRYLAGDLPLDAALAGAKTATRRYAKRQLTWFRNQMADWTTLDPSLPGLYARCVALVAG